MEKKQAAMMIARVSVPELSDLLVQHLAAVLRVNFNKSFIPSDKRVLNAVPLHERFTNVKCKYAL